MKTARRMMLVLVSFIMMAVLFSAILAYHMLIPSVFAQTNAAAIATLASSGNASTNNTANSTANNNGALQIKKALNYFDSSSGYLVYPTTANQSATIGNNKKLPAIIMIHEWWGLNDNIRSVANTLAKQAGYVILAVDLFKGQSTSDPNQAPQLVKLVRDNPAEAVSNMEAAIKYVSSLPFVDSSKIASIGWCFGGGQSLQLALHSGQQPLAATILYYGAPLVTDKQELSKIKWPVLGIFGDKDQAIPLSEIQKFKAALDADGINNEIHIYKGVGHAFANPSNKDYAPNETADAWEKTVAFLKKYV